MKRGIWMVLAAGAVMGVGVVLSAWAAEPEGREGLPKGAATAPSVKEGPAATAAAGEAGKSGPTYEQVKGWIEAYKVAHPGRGGKDWDINAKTPAQLAADPAAQQLMSLCGKDQRPVIPMLAWEYGGSDHRWIKPEVGALVYCVYIPVKGNTEHWQYDKAKDHVIADVYVLFPEQNPGKDKKGAEQVTSCIGHKSNFEILVDTASLHDGKDAGLELSEASTELRLILPDETKVKLFEAK